MENGSAYGELKPLRHRFFFPILEEEEDVSRDKGEKEKLCYHIFFETFWNILLHGEQVGAKETENQELVPFLFGEGNRHSIPRPSHDRVPGISIRSQEHDI